MKEGDIVRVADNSYSYKVENEKLIDCACPGDILGVISPEFKIIKTGLVLPADSDDQKNDTIIEKVESGEIYYTQERFLRKEEEYFEHYQEGKKAELVRRGLMGGVYGKNYSR